MRDIEEWTSRCLPPRGLARPVRLDPAGRTGPTRGQARGRGWRQTSRGFYVRAAVDGTVPEQRILEASVLLPPAGAVTGWAAARWRGAGYFDGLARDGRTPRPVVLAVGVDGDLRERAGIKVSRDRLPTEEVSVVRGVSCTTIERALFDEMRKADNVREAVVAMDMVAAAELTSISRLRAFAGSKPGWNGRPQVMAALDLASEESRSPAETRLRLVWVIDAGLPPPLVNCPVFDLRGTLLGIADLFDPVAGVVGEYDGAAHRRAGRHHRDVRREDQFRRAGLEYFKVVGLDMLDTGFVVDRMLTTRSRAAFLPANARRWTLEAPPGWYDDPLATATLDERLAHREWLRALDAEAVTREASSGPAAHVGR